jgi:WD40 repeat protein
MFGRTSAIAFVIACIALILITLLRLEPCAADQHQLSAKGKPVSADRYGDTLPAGVVARLGTVRLQHAAAVKSLCFSQDGKALLSISSDNFCRLWNVASGKLEYESRPYPEGLQAFAFSPDRSLIATAGTGGAVHLRGFSTAALTRPLATHGPAFTTVIFSQDGKLLAACRPHPEGQTSSIKIWEVATGKCLHHLPNLSEDHFRLSFSPDTSTLIAHGTSHLRKRPGSLTMWDVSTGKRLYLLRTPFLDTGTAAISQDATILSSAAAAEEDIRVWDATNGAEIRRLKGLQVGATRMAISPDGQLLATHWTKPSVIQVCHLRTGREQCRLAVHDQGISSLVFSPDSQFLAAAEYAGVVRMWSRVPGAAMHSWPAHIGPITALAFSLDGKSLASGGEDHTIRVWDTATGNSRSALAMVPRGFDAITWSPNGKLLSTVGYDSFIRLWIASTGEEMRAIRTRYTGGSVSFSAGGETVISYNTERTIGAWDVGTGNRVRVVRVSDQKLSMLVYCPSSQQAVTAIGAPEPLNIWDVTAGRHLLQIPGGGVDAVAAFSPDGRLLASAGGSGDASAIHVWNLASGKEILSFRERASEIDWPPDFLRVPILGFSPDCRMLATVSIRQGVLAPKGQSTIRLWELSTGKERLPIWDAPGAIACVAFSPDGRFLAWGGSCPANPPSLYVPGPHAEAILCLCQLDGVSKAMSLAGHKGRVLGIAFSPDGKKLASVSADGTGLVWDLRSWTSRKSRARPRSMNQSGP